jgi:hypothetical protein
MAPLLASILPTHSYRRAAQQLPVLIARAFDPAQTQQQQLRSAAASSPSPSSHFSRSRTRSNMQAAGVPVGGSAVR